MRIAGRGKRGCLIAFGPNLPKLHQRIADYVIRIFRGVNPGVLPIEGPTHIELVVNMKTARALGLIIPPAIHARTDEVIE